MNRQLYLYLIVTTMINALLMYLGKIEITLNLGINIIGILIFFFSIYSFNKKKYFYKIYIGWRASKNVRIFISIYTIIAFIFYFYVKSSKLGYFSISIRDFGFLLPWFIYWSYSIVVPYLLHKQESSSIK